MTERPADPEGAGTQGQRCQAGHLVPICPPSSPKRNCTLFSSRVTNAYQGSHILESKSRYVQKSPVDTMCLLTTAQAGKKSAIGRSLQSPHRARN